VLSSINFTSARPNHSPVVGKDHDLKGVSTNKKEPGLAFGKQVKKSDGKRQHSGKEKEGREYRLGSDSKTEDTAAQRKGTRKAEEKRQLGLKNRREKVTKNEKTNCEAVLNGGQRIFLLHERMNRIKSRGGK